MVTCWDPLSDSRVSFDKGSNSHCGQFWKLGSVVQVSSWTHCPTPWKCDVISTLVKIRRGPTVLQSSDRQAEKR
ncbi:hypothetical protein J6590_035573 [Homalodisca vitripennis]|nr:hypothetical protein J6590_035573 [Homalodisca vitripennis]